MIGIVSLDVPDKTGQKFRLDDSSSSNKATSGSNDDVSLERDGSKSPGSNKAEFRLDDSSPSNKATSGSNDDISLERDGSKSSGCNKGDCGSNDNGSLERDGSKSSGCQSFALMMYHAGNQVLMPLSILYRYSFSSNEMIMEVSLTRLSFLSRNSTILSMISWWSIGDGQQDDYF